MTNYNIDLSWSREPLIKILFIFIIASLYITPLLPRNRFGFIPIQARFGSVPLGVHHFLYLGITISFALLLIPKFSIKRQQLHYLGFSFALPILIILTGIPQPDLRTVLSHIAVVATVSMIGLLITCSTELSLSDVAYSAYLGGVVVALWDFIIFLSPTDFQSATSPLIRFINKGGIAADASMGTHGIVVGMGVIAGLSLLKWKPECPFRKQILLISSILLMVFTILLSGSRSSLLALIIGASFFYSYKLHSLSRRVYTLFVMFLMLLLVGVVYIVASWRWRTVLQRIEQNLAAVELTLSYPLTGVGWQHIFPRYLNHVIHNTPLNYFASGGIILGMTFMIVFLYPFLIGIRGLITKSGSQELIRTFVSMWFVIIIELMLYKSTPSIYLLIIGMMICTAATKRREEIYNT